MSWNLQIGEDFPKGAWLLDKPASPDISGYDRTANGSVIQNLVLNPRLDGATGWDGGVGGPITRNASGGWNGMPYHEMTASGSLTQLYHGNITNNTILTPGKTYTATMYIDATPTYDIDLYVSLVTSTGGNTRQVRSTKQQLNGWTRFSATFTTASNETGFRMGGALYTKGGNIPAGVFIRQTAASVVEGAIAPYFDGTFPGASWTSGANSLSTIPSSIFGSPVNLAPDPRATVLNSGLVGSWSSNRWFGAAPAAGTYTVVSNATDAPEGMTSYIRKTWTTGTGGTNYGDVGFTLSGHFPVVPGETLDVSWLIRSSVVINEPYISFYWQGPSRTNAGNGVTTIPANTWKRLSASTVVPAGATGVQIAVDARGTFEAGSTIDGTGLIVTKSGKVSYFDGNTVGAKWSGTPNASASYYYANQKYGVSLVKGAERSLIVDPSNKVSFPNNIWNRNKEYLPFTIEAFIRPVIVDASNTAEIQILGHDGQMDGLTIQKGVISFVTKYTNTGEARASFDTMNHQTSHVVGLHTATKNSLYINGEMVAEVEITPEQQADTYAVAGGDLSTGTTTGPNKLMLNAVAIYEGVLDEESIDLHYSAAQDTLTAEDVAIDYGGQLLEFVSTGAYTPFFRMDYDSNQMWELGGRTNCSLHEGVLYPLTIDGVSVNGWWETVLPLGTAPSAIEAVSILWEGTGAIVKTSRDGILWEVAEKGKPVGTVPVGTLPEGEFLYVRVEFPGDKIDDPSFMDNMSVSVYLSDNPTAFAGREVVMSKAVPENDYDVNDLHQDWGAEMNDGSITIKAAANNTGAVARTVEVWVQRTGSTFTSSLTSANRIRTNGGQEQPTNLGEWQLRHYVFDADFTGDITFSGTAQIGHIVVYPQSLSDETIAEIYKAYTGKPKVVLDVDEVFNIYEFAGQVDIYEYDWALASAT